MGRVAFLGHLLTVLGGFLVFAGWIVGGFPVPDGDAAGMLWIGIVAGLLGEAVVWMAGRRRRDGRVGLND